MSFTGDFAGLLRITKQIEELKSLVPKTADAGADGIRDLIAQQFASGTDPYGTPWAPKKDGSTPLAEIADTVSVTSDGKTITVRVDAPSAEFHQTGTSRMPQRRILPDEDDLPPEWEAVLTAAAQDNMPEGEGEG